MILKAALIIASLELGDLKASALGGCRPDKTVIISHKMRVLVFNFTKKVVV